MPIKKNCERCGEPFSMKPGDAERRRFCSRACRHWPVGTDGKPSKPAPVDFLCKSCGDKFTYKASYLTAYRKKFGKDPIYCSMPCSDAGRRADTEARRRSSCERCGSTIQTERRLDGTIRPNQKKFCSAECKNETIKQKALARFNSGGYRAVKGRHGYMRISLPSLVTGKKSAILEHRWVMSQHLGRDLRPDETVHHKDGVRHNNALDNLELFSSRHGPGQRVTDKVTFAIEILRLYPEFAREAGVELRDVAHLTIDRIPDAAE